MSFREEINIDLSLIKTVNVIWNDPDATDSSSDDEDISDDTRRQIKTKPPKCYISKICVPTLLKRSENVSNCTGNKVNGNRKSSSGNKGVRRRPWGRYATEISDPFEKKRTFDERLGLVIPEVDLVDLTKPCGARKPKVKEVKSTKSSVLTRSANGKKANKTSVVKTRLGLAKPEVDLVDLTKPCGVRKRKVKEVGSTKPDDLLPSRSSVLTRSPNGKKVSKKSVVEKTFGCGYVDDQEEGMIDKMLEDPIMPLSMSDLFPDSVDGSSDIWVGDSAESHLIFDEPKLDFLEDDRIICKKTTYGFKIGDNTKVNQQAEIVNILDDGSTDLFEFDPLTDDFQLEDFPMDDFGLLGEPELDDFSWFNGSTDWID